MAIAQGMNAIKKSATPCSDSSEDGGGSKAKTPLPALKVERALRALFLVSATKSPCGVESFARRLAENCREAGLDQSRVAINGAIGDIFAIWKELAKADALVMNVPIVAWKKILLTPVLACLMASGRGKRTILILHEWSDLDWRRREICFLYAMLAKHILFSSPLVRAQFLKTANSRGYNPPTSIIPIPANIEPVSTPEDSQFVRRIRARRNEGALIIGHFGSIYPKKHTDFVLDVAARLKRRGRPIFVTFVGGFIKGMDRVEEDFFDKATRLGVDKDILVTGYVASNQEIFSVLQEMDCFVYQFAEGLTSRRGSVLACVRAERTVVVNAPRDADEFAHHRVYRAALESGAILLVDTDADADQYADVVGRLALTSKPAPIATTLYRQCWDDGALALKAACAPHPTGDS